ncbi:MAG: hypothetical protein RL181_2234 [Bacteroidota bacterium]|jgi:hypothetical protein
MNEFTPFARLEEEIRPFFPVMGQASDTIIDENVSNYPIFVVSQLDIELGIPIVQRQEEGNPWSVYASTLEEMSAKKIVQAERVSDFRSIFKDPRDYLCLFVLSDLGAKFIFLPRM